MRKQKLFNQGNPVLFIDSTNTNVSPSANRSGNTQEQSIGRSKRVTMKLHLCCTVSCLVVFCLSPGNLYDASKKIKLIESIYPKNNSYLLMDRVYEDDKTIALAKTHGFNAVVSPKKNRKFH